MDQPIPFGVTRSFGQTTFLTTSPAQLTRHFYLLGQSGTGKSTVLFNLALSLLRSGHGFAVFDPHGDLVERLLTTFPRSRTNDLCLFRPFDLSFPIAFNILASPDPSQKPLLVDHLVTLFQTLFGEAYWGPRSSYLLQNALWVLLSQPKPFSLAFLPKLLLDASFRARLLKAVKDPFVLRFFRQEYESYRETYRQEVIAPLLNKVGLLLLNPSLRLSLGQVTNKVSARFLMDKGKVLLLDLSKGRLGREASQLLGGLWLIQFYLAALSRSDLPEGRRRPFFLLLDEVQSFVSVQSFEGLLSEGRKFGVGLVVAHQYLGQIPETALGALLGNCANLLVFRVSAPDAQRLVAELDRGYGVAVHPEDLLNLPDHAFYCRRWEGGRYLEPCYGQTLPPMGKRGDEQKKETLIAVSRRRFGTPAGRVRRWLGRKLR